MMKKPEPIKKPLAEPIMINSLATFEQKLYDLSNRVANSVHGEAATVQEKIDALKTLTQTFGVLNKFKNPVEEKDENPDEFAFDKERGLNNVSSPPAPGFRGGRRTDA